MPPRIKVCCIQSLDEARLAIDHGAAALGLVSAMPSGPGPISEERIAEIASRIPPGVTSVLLTCAQDIATIVAQQRRTGVNALQLVDELLDGTHAELRRELPGVALLQVLHVTGQETVDDARRLGPEVHALLLDSGDPRLAIKLLGGTGRVHDWELSRRIVDTAPCPVFLAGGLHAGNAAEAVARVRPFGLDLCSGARSAGALDPARLSAFFAAVRGTRVPSPPPSP